MLHFSLENPQAARISDTESKHSGRVALWKYFYI